MADSELSKRLERRFQLAEPEENGTVTDLPKSCNPSSTVFNPYTEFKEFSRKQIQDYEKMFKKYDVNKDNAIDLDELKRMMEDLGSPQTHLSLKNMIKEVDEDNDLKINLREFLLIFRKASVGEISQDDGLFAIYSNVTEVDVDKEGVGGAKKFFEAKIDEKSASCKFEQEIKEEQEQRKLEEEAKKEKRKQFKEKANFFQAAGTNNNQT